MLSSELKRCQATPSWTICVPFAFTEIDNGDSWQARAHSTVVYVSSMKVADGASPVRAVALREIAVRKLASHPEVERHTLEESAVQGDTQIFATATGFKLKGFACMDGSVATCVIDFAQEADRKWAIDTWKSLRPSASTVKARPWWRFW
jgi:hypothetical protein